jgi:hypothetical protein
LPTSRHAVWHLTLHQGGGNSKKLKKITRKVKGKAPKEICWREMTKHQIGKKNGEKSKKNKEESKFFKQTRHFG